MYVHTYVSSELLSHTTSYNAELFSSHVSPWLQCVRLMSVGGVVVKTNKYAEKQALFHLDYKYIIIKML